jgi:hypothetical protein
MADEPRPIRARIRAHSGNFPALQQFVPSWPLIVGLVFFIRALVQPMALLNDPDTYLHIAAGRWMLAHAALPITTHSPTRSLARRGCRMSGWPRSSWRPPMTSPAGAGWYC